MLIQPYLSFDGRCEEALEFYKSALGARVTMLMRFKESPTPCAMIPPDSEEKIMHAVFSIGDSILKASDGQCGGKAVFQGMSLVLTVSSAADADRAFAALADGGHVQMPLGETFFSPRFGMVADRFGVSWMVVVAH